MQLSRKQKYAQETRDALIASSRTLFTEQGYSKTSLDLIAQSADLTKGAIYHHFKNKQEIFETIMISILEESIQYLETHLASITDTIQKAIIAVDLFLDLCVSREYQQIVLLDGPIVLGWEKWRDLEKQYTYHFVAELVAELVDDSNRSPLSNEVLARLIMAWVIEVAFMTMETESQEELRAEAKSYLLKLIATS